MTTISYQFQLWVFFQNYAATTLMYRVRQKNMALFEMKYHNEVSPFYVKVVITGKLNTCHFKF